MTINNRSSVSKRGVPYQDCEYQPVKTFGDQHISAAGRGCCIGNAVTYAAPPLAGDTHNALYLLFILHTV